MAKMTAAQRRELWKVKAASNGRAMASAAAKTTQTRLEKAGLIELLEIDAMKFAEGVFQHRRWRWFLTPAGRAALKDAP